MSIKNTEPNHSLVKINTEKHWLLVILKFFDNFIWYIKYINYIPIVSLSKYNHY